MFERFPFGKAPFWLFVVATVSSVAVGVVSKRTTERPFVLLATFSEPHYNAYRLALPRFEREHHVKVSVELTHWSSLQAQLQSAILADSDVPDVIEVVEDSLGYFTTGPTSDVGIVDFTDLIRKEGIDRQIVASRFGLWMAHGRNYGIPHDVHPVMLAYRRDLVEQLGIDVNQLDTWDKFAEVGRRVTKDKDGDGEIDQYMLELPAGGNWALPLLLLQRGGGLFDANGDVTLDSEDAAQVINWYVHQTQGPNKIANDCGWAQPLMKAMSDGLALFFFTPDWRSRIFENEAPQLAGKMALMPLPAWHPGGRRTSVWGGTGLIITKHTKHPALAWELAKYLYFDKSALGERFGTTNVIPPFKDAWSLPEFSRPNPFYSNQPIGKLYAALAPDTPVKYSSPESDIAKMNLEQSLSRAVLYYNANGDEGLMDYVRTELKQAANQVRERTNRYAVFHPKKRP